MSDDISRQSHRWEGETPHVDGNYISSLEAATIDLEAHRKEHIARSGSCEHATVAVDSDVLLEILSLARQGLIVRRRAQRELNGGE